MREIPRAVTEFQPEHPLKMDPRKEEMEEQFNKEAKEGWRCAADAATISDEHAGTEDRKHTSGGAFVAVDKNLEGAVGAEEEAIDSIPGNERRTTQAWVKA